MQSSTRLQPTRQPYVSVRMVNEVYGKSHNRELADGYQKLDEMAQRRDKRWTEQIHDTRRQIINRTADSMYLW